MANNYKEINNYLEKSFSCNEEACLYCKEGKCIYNVSPVQQVSARVCDVRDNVLYEED